MSAGDIIMFSASPSGATRATEPKPRPTSLCGHRDSAVIGSEGPPCTEPTGHAGDHRNVSRNPSGEIIEIRWGSWGLGVVLAKHADRKAFESAASAPEATPPTYDYVREVGAAHHALDVLGVEPPSAGIFVESEPLAVRIAKLGARAASPASETSQRVVCRQGRDAVASPLAQSQDAQATVAKNDASENTQKLNLGISNGSNHDDQDDGGPVSRRGDGDRSGTRVDSGTADSDERSPRGAAVVARSGVSLDGPEGSEGSARRASVADRAKLLDLLGHQAEVEDGVTTDAKERAQLYRLAAEIVRAAASETPAPEPSEIEALRTQAEEMRRLAIIPGSWRCDQCSFALVTVALNPHTGTTGAQRVVDSDELRCPNDGTQLRSATWKERVADMAALIDRQDAELARWRGDDAGTPEAGSEDTAHE